MQLCIKHGDGEVVDKAWGDLVRRTTALQGMRSNLNMESSRWARANRRLKAINTLSLTLITQSCETYLIQNTRPELITDTFREFFDTPVETAQDVHKQLKRLAPYYDEDKEYWENGHLVGLARPGVAVSLEPGGQVETSIGILKKPSDLNTLYSKFRRELDPILDDLDFRLINYGYQPKSSFADVPVNPKDRYDAMTDYLGRVGQFGPCMMRCSASTQVSIDYVDERDSIEKLRLGTVIGPILAYFFRNTPYFEGEKNPWPLLRQRMWDYLDFQRTNVLPGLFDPRYGWEDYAIDVLSTPLMFADLTHTPEAVASGATPKELHRPAFRENAGEVYPDRELNPYEINHIISTHFNDVRLKNFIELRHWDSLPIERAERLTEIVSSLFYVPEHRDRLESYFEGISEEEVFEAKANIQAHGREASPYGQPLDFWKEFLGLEGLLSDIPGDLKHPDVFQE